DHASRLHRVLAAHDVQVGPADRAEGHPHHGLTKPRPRPLHILDPEPVRSPKYVGFHHLRSCSSRGEARSDPSGGPPHRLAAPALPDSSRTGVGLAFPMPARTMGAAPSTKTAAWSRLDAG